MTGGDFFDSQVGLSPISVVNDSQCNHYALFRRYALSLYWEENRITDLVYGGGKGTPLVD
jgi:hypothetical protein